MADTKRDIAELLKTQRENLGLSIDEIHERTRIDPGFLRAFEEGNFDVLPRAYARLFLRTYARELGLDARDILTRFEKIIVTPPARPRVQASSKHRLNFRLSSLLLLACVFILVAIIVLNIGKKTEPTAPLDTTASQPPVAQPPPEIQPTLRDSAQQTDDPISAQNDTLQRTPEPEDDAAAAQSDTVQITPSESENSAASQSENQEAPTPESENDAGASQSENQERPTPARSDTLQRTPSESESGAASPSTNRETLSPVQSDTLQRTPSESENSAASQSENREMTTPARSDTVQITPSESENSAGPQSENQETPTPARSDTLQRTPSESENSAGPQSENRETPTPESETNAIASQAENRDTPSFGRDFVPPVVDVLTTYNLPLPVVIADDDLMILSCVATETTTLSITADGRDLFAGILPAGNAQRWQARDQFQVYVPRAGAISLSLQDAPLESASPPDRGLRLNISRISIRVEELGE